MSRSVALLPFEVSRWAPEPVQLEDEPDFDAEAFDGDEPFEPDPSFDSEAFEEGTATADQLAGEDATAEGEPAADEQAMTAGAAPEESAGDEDEGSLEARADSEAFEDFEDLEGLEQFEASEESESLPRRREDGERENEDEAPVEHAHAGEGEGAGATEEDRARETEEDRAREEEAEPVNAEDASFADAGFDEEAAFDEEIEWLARADRTALASWIREELAALFAGSGALRPILIELDEDELAEAEELDDLELSLSPEPGAAAAEAAGAELGLACRIRADASSVELSGLLSDVDGEERVRFALACELGAAHLLPQRAARELLSALGEDAAAGALPELDESGAVDPEAVLGLCRGARSLAESRRAPEGDPLADPLLGLRELLAALALSPTLAPARELILRGAEAAAGSAAMPAYLSALEQLALMFPTDATVLAALAAYRRLHHDGAGARELLLRARDLAANGEEEAAVLAQLAALAEEEGRADEAIQHLRAATRLADDPGVYLRLGNALRESDPQESARSFQRAVVLEPRSALARLLLARQLRALGETGRAGTEAARASQLAGEDSETAEAAAALLRELTGDARA